MKKAFLWLVGLIVSWGIGWDIYTSFKTGASVAHWLYLCAILVGFARVGSGRQDLYRHTLTEIYQVARKEGLYRTPLERQLATASLVLGLLALIAYFCGI